MRQRLKTLVRRARLIIIILTVKHSGGIMEQWGCFIAARSQARGLFLHNECIVEEKSLQSTNDLRLMRLFICQQDNDAKHMAKTSKERLQDFSSRTCECPGVAQPESRLEFNWTSLELSENGCTNIPPSPGGASLRIKAAREELRKARWAELVASYSKRL